MSFLDKNTPQGAGRKRGAEMTEQQVAIIFAIIITVAVIINTARDK